MADTTAPYSLTSRLVAEVFGTFVLVFGVIGTALFADQSVGFLGIAIAVGLAVLPPPTRSGTSRAATSTRPSRSAPPPPGACRGATSCRT